MYKITWDKETGGVRLSSKVEAGTIGVPPRPVFFEELDLLELDKLGWCYPRCQEPLLWACNKQYFYRGQLVFEAKGANVYDKATVIFQPGMEKLSLQPVDVATMLERNKDEMFLIESEAIEFIRDTYLQYSNARKTVAACTANQLDFEALAAKTAKRTKQAMAIVKQDCDSFDIMPLDTAQQQGKKVYATTKIDKFLASFSGGKDSQVVLDLCTRAIPSTEFEVIYSDTGYELPTSLTLYEQVQAHYQEKFPDLKFSIARNHESVLNYWDQIGTPSDTHRWCCSVMKTAPLYRMLKIEGTNKQAKVLAFEGVRAEESVKRSSYNRIGKGVKHSHNVINAHPILFWNTIEVFLYLFKWNLPINTAYRIGKARVGCIICPFSSAWDDMIAKTYFQEELNPFLNRITTWNEKSGVKNTEEFIKERNWKIRASGNNNLGHTKVIFKQLTPTFIAEIENPKHKIETWLPALGDFSINHTNNKDSGELRYNTQLYSFEIRYNENKCTLKVANIIDSKLIGHLRKLINKSAYCIQCEICEIDCPTGALTIYPQLKINKKECIHCLRCFDSHDNGCLISDSIRMITETSKKSEMAVHAYKTFGLREDWLVEFFLNKQDFWKHNSLGTAQEDAMKIWLKDAEIIDKKNIITPLGTLLADLYENYPFLVWEIILVHLMQNSYIINWFTKSINENQAFDKKTLCEMISTSDAAAAKTTLEAAIGALLQLFKNSPFGESFGFAINEGKMLVRHYYSHLSREAAAYSLYKFAESRGIKSFRVSDLYSADCKGGPYREFGIRKDDLEQLLRSLNSDSNRVLLAELNMGLDHITLRDDLTAIETLKILTK